MTENLKEIGSYMKQATCHPDRKHRARGMCSACYSSWWIQANPQKNVAKSKKSRRKLRQEVLAHYGGNCQCCGEGRNEFLSIDHINGGGKQHRLGAGLHGVKFYQWLKASGYPEGFQVLCHNCNLAKGFYGQCPHERDREAARNDINEYYRQLAGWPGATTSFLGDEWRDEVSARDRKLFHER